MSNYQSKVYQIKQNCEIEQLIKAPIPSIELSIAQERLRQSRYSFNLAIAATAISFFISLVGAGILLSNKVPQGTVIAAVGLVSGVQCTKLAKDANDRLDKILAEEKED